MNIYRPKKLWRGGEVEDLVSTKQGFMNTFGEGVEGVQNEKKSLQSFNSLAEPSSRILVWEDCLIAQNWSPSEEFG